MTGFASFASLIKRRCGLSFAEDRRPLLETALHRRRTATGLDDAGYFGRLIGCDREFGELVSLLTINETYFRREPQHLALLTERLLPRLLARSGRRLPLRILSAGCSTGEEPYSIALALHDHYGASAGRLVRVVGGDIDLQALTRARAGRFKEFSFRGVDAAFKSRHFHFDGTAYTLAEAGRELVEFVPLNLLDDGVIEGGGRYDVIFLRNVTIYFDEPTRRDIQRRLRALLSDDGYLLVGMAETLANDFGLLPLLQEDGLFYFAADGAARPETPDNAPSRPPSPPPPVAEAEPPVIVPPPPPVGPSPPPVGPSPLSAGPSPAAARFGDLGDAARLTWERSYDRALDLLDRPDAEPGADEPGAIARPLLKAFILLDRKDFAGAEAAARRALALDSWSTDAFLVLGQVARHSGRTDEALSWWKRAVYASHGCWPAHYHLGDLHRATGDLESARSAYRTALRLLSAGTGTDTGLKALLPGFPAADIRFLCERHLSLIESLIEGSASPPPPPPSRAGI